MLLWEEKINLVIKLEGAFFPVVEELESSQAIMWKLWGLGYGLLLLKAFSTFS